MAVEDDKRLSPTDLRALHMMYMKRPHDFRPCPAILGDPDDLARVVAPTAVELLVGYERLGLQVEGGRKSWRLFEGWPGFSARIAKMFSPS